MRRECRRWAISENDAPADSGYGELEREARRTFRMT
jgi:hypothetical protein